MWYLCNTIHLCISIAIIYHAKHNPCQLAVLRTIMQMRMIRSKRVVKVLLSLSRGGTTMRGTFLPYTFFFLGWIK